MYIMYSFRFWCPHVNRIAESSLAMFDSIAETPSLRWQLAQATTTVLMFHPLRLCGHSAAGALEKLWSVSYGELDKHQLPWCCTNAAGALCRHAMWAENRKRQLPWKLLLSARHGLLQETAGLVGISRSRCQFHVDLLSSKRQKLSASYQVCWHTQVKRWVRCGPARF